MDIQPSPTAGSGASTTAISARNRADQDRRAGGLVAEAAHQEEPGDRDQAGDGGQAAVQEVLPSQEPAFPGGDCRLFGVRRHRRSADGLTGKRSGKRRSASRAMACREPTAAGGCQAAGPGRAAAREREGWRSCSPDVRPSSSPVRILVRISRFFYPISYAASQVIFRIDRDQRRRWMPRFPGGSMLAAAAARTSLRAGRS